MFEAFITRFFILVCHYIWHQLKISPPIFYVSIYLTEMHFSSTTPWDLLSPNLSLEGGLSWGCLLVCLLYSLGQVLGVEEDVGSPCIDGNCSPVHSGKLP